MKFLNSRRQALALGLVSVISLAACGGGGSDAGTPVQPWSEVSGSNAVTALKTTDTTVGTGATAASGTTVSVNYTGWLYDVRVATTQKGTQFDTSVGKTPFSFKLGTNAVIPGFEQGVTGMKVGGKRTVVIPASLAYGSQSNSAIPANAALIFDIELLSVQ